MRFAWGLEQPIGRYLSAHFPELMTLGEYVPHKAVGFVNSDGRLIGALAMRYESTFEAQLSIHTEQPNFITPRQLRELFRYAFDEARLVRLTCQIMKRNRKARTFVEKIGFKLEGVKRKGFDGRRDACVYGMTRDQCRWL